MTSYLVHTTQHGCAITVCDINNGICVLPASSDCLHLSYRFRRVISLEVFKSLRTVFSLLGILSLDWNFLPFLGIFGKV